MPPIRNQSFNGTSARYNNGSSNSNHTSASFNGTSVHSRAGESFTESTRDQHDRDRELEDAAVERAVRLYELEAAKSRYLNEDDLRAFATTVFRRMYRSQRSRRAGSTMPEVSEEPAASSEPEDEDEAETSEPEHSRSHHRYSRNHFSVDVMSLPYHTQRKLLKSMYKICLSSAFYFTKKYNLPLTLNVESPFPQVTRLTIQDLTDSIMDAYNKLTIPNNAVDEDILYGFAGVFQAAVVLDDAIMYFDKTLSDRRMRSILLAGIDLTNALRDQKAADDAESVLAETEERIEEFRRKSWERESMETSMADTDVDMSDDDDDDEETLEDAPGDKQGSNLEKARVEDKKENGAAN